MSDPVETIHRAIEFIEAHLQNETSVAEMAAAAGYSLFHFVRTFDRIVQHTPYDYLMRRRLTEAGRALAAGDRRIIDISQDFCFNNHETFSRAFKRMFAMQPIQWRERKPDDAILGMPPLTFADLRFINREDFKPPLIVEFLSSRLCGLMSAQNGDQQGDSRLLAHLRRFIPGPLPERFIAVNTYLGTQRQPVYTFIGINQAFSNDPPSILVETTLPAGKYVCIECSIQDMPCAKKYLMYTWCLKAGYRPVSDLDVQMIPTDENIPQVRTLCIPLRPEDAG